MTKTRKGLMVAVLVLALLIAAGGGVAAWYTGSYNSYSRHVALGARYLEEGDYENAVLAYQHAIQLRPEGAEAYLGLVRVYQTRGQNILAESLLRTGIARTGSARMTLMLEDLGGTAQGTAEDAGKAQGDAALNTQLLTMFGSCTYNDYRLRNGIESTEMTGTDECTVRANGIAATMRFRDAGTNSLDRVGGQPAADSYPAEVVLDDLSTLFGGARQVTAEQLRAMGAQDVAVEQDGGGGFTVRFTAAGCQVTVAADEEGTTLPQGAHTIVPLAVLSGEVADANVEGRVISATTGAGVPNAEIRFHAGSLTSGEAIATVKTDTHGSYSVALDSGNYTAEVRCSGYTTECFPLYVNASGRSVESDFVISPLLSEGQIRIVLEWGSFPTDLDSYLDGNLDDGTPVHVNFTSRTARAGGQVVADLDVDDTTSYGPETTTLHNTNGVFTFTVEDYQQTGQISSSGATVKIYMPGESAPHTVSVPSGLRDVWHVCIIDHGQLQITNHG